MINIDAHFDVRPLKNGKAHSGSPFRLMLENAKFLQLQGKFIEFSAKGCSTNTDHYNYLMERGAEVVWLERDIRRFEVSPEDTEVITQAGQYMKLILNDLAKKVDLIFFSFDVDTIDSQYCPGVSAPSVVGGLTEAEALELAFLAGQCKQVAMMDLSEYNPAVELLRTGRLLANIYYQFCKGVAERF